MSFLRRSNQSLIQSIRQLTITNIAQTNRENAVRAVGMTGLNALRNNVENHVQKKEAAKSLVSHLQFMKQQNPLCTIGNQQSVFSPPAGAKLVMASSARVEKMFASFDLGSISISFVGMIGDFAVWAITDMSTGELIYLIDDNS
jgi:hypothetical protein